MPPLQENSFGALAPSSRQALSKKAKASPFFRSAALTMHAKRFQRVEIHPMPMPCPRCCGLLVTEPSLDFYAQSDLWKCVNCGAFPTIGASTPAGMRESVGGAPYETREDR